LLDEIGRGTSTFDGLSIAWAVAEDLHDRLGARTLFATHYHELCDLAQQKTGIHNAHMAVKEWNGQIIFLRKLTAGGTNRSYGVTVAGMAGLPPAVVKRAREIMTLLEQMDLGFQDGLAQRPEKQISLFTAPQQAPPVVQNRDEAACIAAVRAIDVESLTPLAALNELARLKGLLTS
jgi:DNA mismatch repair protein MutS